MVQFLWQDDLLSVARFIATVSTISRVVVIHLNQPQAAGTDVNFFFFFMA
jgi:hypothetical protein